MCASERNHLMLVKTSDVLIATRIPMVKTFSTIAVEAVTAAIIEATIVAPRANSII